MLVEPGVGIGPMRLGMTRDEVASILGGTPLAIEQMGIQVEHYSAAGLHCEYEPDGRVQSVEADDRAVPELFGHRSLGLPVSQLRSHLEGAGVEILAEDEAGFDGPGFGVYVEDGVVKAVLVFGEEYQQKLLALHE